MINSIDHQEARMTEQSTIKPTTLLDRVQAVISRIRPAVQSDGGDLELVEITKDNVCKIRLHGACVSCPSSSITLRNGIERNIREKVPEINAVERVQ
jgi:Fe-S cluster biogenesis protein NfuA